MSGISFVDGVWRALDELALSDFSGYQKFVSEQLNLGPSLLSKPRCRGFQKCTLREGRPLFVNICEWDLIDAPKSNTDPIPLYCGNIYVVNAEKTVSIAMHSSVFEQYDFSRDGSNATNQPREGDHLIALIILYLKREKNIQTREGDLIHERKNPPKFSTEWSNRPHGGDDLMLESLSYKKLSLTQLAIRPPTETTDEICAHHVGTQNKLVEEIKPQPHWQLNQTGNLTNVHEYTIQLPLGTRMKDCELDISASALSLKLKGSCDFPDPFYVKLADPINPHKAKAKFAKSTCRLSVVAPN